MLLILNSDQILKTYWLLLLAPLALQRGCFCMYPALTRSSSARRTVLMDSFVSLLIVRTEGKHFPSLSARLRRYMYTVTARLGRSSAQIVSNQPLTRSPASAPASAAPGTAPAPVQSAAPAGYRTLSVSSFSTLCSPHTSLPAAHAAPMHTAL